MDSIDKLFEFEQRIDGDKREVRIVQPYFKHQKLESYTLVGNEARKRIVKFVCAMFSGLCDMSSLDNNHKVWIHRLIEQLLSEFGIE